MSPLPCIGGSDNQLVPLEKVIVFFYRGDNKTKSGSMVSHNRALEHIIDLTDKHEQSWKLNDDKDWVTVKEKK